MSSQAARVAHRSDRHVPPGGAAAAVPKSQAARPSRLPLRARLLLLVCASILPLLTFALGEQYLAYRAARAAIGAQTLHLARSLALLVENELQGEIRALQIMTHSVPLRAGDYPAFRSQADQIMASLPPGVDISVVQADGQELMNTAYPPGAALPVREETVSLRRMFATGQPSVSDIYFGVARQRMMVAIDVPILGPDGQVSLALSINRAAGAFSDLISAQDLPNLWVSSIFDRQARRVARLPVRESRVGELAKSGQVVAIMLATGTDRTIDYAPANAAEMMVAISRGKRFGWSVTVSVPKSELRGPAWRTALRTLAAGLMMLTLGLALALLVARQITGPITVLRRLAGAQEPLMLHAGATTGLRETDEVLQALVRSATEEQAARRALQDSERKLRQAQRMEAIGQLTGGLAHDFNNILGIILGNAELMLDTVATLHPEGDYARTIHRGATSGAELVRRLLAFARRQTLEPAVIDINQGLPQQIELLQRTLGEAIIVTFLRGDALWLTRADPSQVMDALLNLAINARDAMPNGGSLVIKTGNAVLDEAFAAKDPDVAPGDYVVLAVTDSGSGMLPEVLERAIEPFFTTKPPGAGSGLGLSMIYGFARQSGGHLRINSGVGAGTTVTLYLPRALAGEAAAAVTAREAAPAEPGHETILVVDDNPELRQVAMRHLVRLGYSVREAASGPAALTMLRSEVPHLLFTDIVMPGGMTGYELADAAQAAYPQLKVVFASGYASAPPPGRVVRHLLRKPYRKEELAAAIRAALAG